MKSKFICALIGAILVFGICGFTVYSKVQLDDQISNCLKPSNFSLKFNNINYADKSIEEPKVVYLASSAELGLISYFEIFGILPGFIDEKLEKRLSLCNSLVDGNVEVSTSNSLLNEIELDESLKEKIVALEKIEAGEIDDVYVNSLISDNQLKSKVGTLDHSMFEYAQFALHPQGWINSVVERYDAQPLDSYSRQTSIEICVKLGKCGVRGGNLLDYLFSTDLVARSKLLEKKFDRLYLNRKIYYESRAKYIRQNGSYCLHKLISVKSGKSWRSDMNLALSKFNISSRRSLRGRAFTQIRIEAPNGGGRIGSRSSTVEGTLWRMVRCHDQIIQDKIGSSYKKVADYNELEEVLEKYSTYGLPTSHFVVASLLNGMRQRNLPSVAEQIEIALDEWENIFSQEVERIMSQSESKRESMAKRIANADRERQQRRNSRTIRQGSNKYLASCSLKCVKPDLLGSGSDSWTIQRRYSVSADNYSDALFNAEQKAGHEVNKACRSSGGEATFWRPYSCTINP